MKYRLAVFVTIPVILGTLSGLGVAAYSLKNTLNRINQDEAESIGKAMSSVISREFSNIENSIFLNLRKFAQNPELSQSVAAEDSLAVIRNMIPFSSEWLPVQADVIYINRGEEISWVNDSAFFDRPVQEGLIEKIEENVLNSAVTRLDISTGETPQHVLVYSSNISAPTGFETLGEIRAVFSFDKDSPLIKQLREVTEVDCLAIIKEGNKPTISGGPMCHDVLNDFSELIKGKVGLNSKIVGDYAVTLGSLSENFPYQDISFISAKNSTVGRIQQQQTLWTIVYVAASLLITGVISTIIASHTLKKTIQNLLTFIGDDLTQPPSEKPETQVREFQQIADAHYNARIRLLQEIMSRAAAESDVELLHGKLRSAHSEKMEALGLLTAGVAHDFNNILAIIKSSTELMQPYGHNEPQLAELLDSLMTATNRASLIVSDLLLYVRDNHDLIDIADLAEITISVIDLFRVGLGPEFYLSLDIEDEKFPVKVDTGKCAAALTNLASNARDAMPYGGRIAISIGRSGINKDGQPMCYVEVRDTGCGISEENLTKVMAPFFTTKAEGAGIGLGLSLVHSFATQSGGEIVISSKLKQGTTVRMNLPMTQARAGKVVKLEPTKSQAKIRNELKVLLVEDEEVLAKNIILGLEYLGVAVEHAISVAKARKLLSLRLIEYDCIITDLRLNDGSGREVVEFAKSIDPFIPIIVSSGDMSPENTTGMFELSNISFLQKPVKISEINDAILTLIAKSADCSKQADA